MLELTIPSKEGWDESKQEFVRTKEQTIVLEHSLVSLSKWESKYHKPFLSNDEVYKKTSEELLYYIKCMTITQNVDPAIYQLLNAEEFKIINDYIDNTMTATWFSQQKNSKTTVTKSFNKETITSELIYYWMIELGIPFECQRWHLNRLLTLIRICNVKEQQSGKGGKMSKRDILSQNRSLNAARRSRLGTKG